MNVNERAQQSERSVALERSDADVSVSHFADEFLAAVYLETEVSLAGMHAFWFGVLHDLNTVDPGSDRRWILGDASSYFIPLTVSPEILPRFGQYRAWMLLVLIDCDLIGSGVERKVPHAPAIPIPSPKIPPTVPPTW